ncbi:hypothetical protein [Longispora urticae]
MTGDREQRVAREAVAGDGRRLHDAYVAKVNSAVAAGREELVAELVARYGRESRTGPTRQQPGALPR